MGRVKTSVVFSGNGRRRNSIFDSWVPFTTTFTNLSELVVSQEHYNWRAAASNADRGGPFMMTKVSHKVSPMNLGNSVYEGPRVIASAAGNPPFANPQYRSIANMYADGTTSIARTLPTNPVMSLTTTLGEVMREGLPRIIGSQSFKSQVSTARKSGGEYLNYQFGWLPLISDLRKFAHGVKHRDEIMYSYIKGSDRKIRVAYEYPSDTGIATQYYINMIHGDNWCNGNTSIVDERSTRRWFKGAFRYHVPVTLDQKGKFAYYREEADKILGLELTPEVVWNLAPWTWAIDWFSNTGDVLRNVSRLGKDGLAMQYGYQMCHSQSSREITFKGNPNEPLIKGHSSYYKMTNETKQRIPASPYGFGLTFDGFSNTQKAVIVALGLTRGRRNTSNPYDLMEH